MAIGSTGERCDLIVGQPAVASDDGVLAKFVLGTSIGSDAEDHQFTLTRRQHALVEQKTAQQVEALEQLWVFPESAEDVEWLPVMGECSGHDLSEFAVEFGERFDAGLGRSNELGERFSGHGDERTVRCAGDRTRVALGLQLPAGDVWAFRSGVIG